MYWNLIGAQKNPQVQASRVKYIEDAIAKDPNDTDHIIEREFVDEICEKHAKPGETLYDPSHDMNLTGEKGHWVLYWSNSSRVQYTHSFFMN